MQEVVLDERPPNTPIVKNSPSRTLMPDVCGFVSGMIGGETEEAMTSFEIF